MKWAVTHISTSLHFAEGGGEPWQGRGAVVINEALVACEEFRSKQ